MLAILLEALNQIASTPQRLALRRLSASGWVIHVISDADG